MARGDDANVLSDGDRMPVVFDQTEEPVGAEPGKKDGASSSPGAVAMALLQRGSADPEAYAAILRAHPDFRQSLIQLLHQRFGNSFVTAVLDVVDRKPAAQLSADRESASSDGQNTVLAESDGPGRERNPEVAARNKANAVGRSKQRVERSDGGVVDGVLDDAGGRIPLGPATEEVPRSSHREGLIQGIGKIQETIFRNIDRGIERSIGLIEAAEAPRDADQGWLMQLLAFAAGNSIYGLSAAIGAWAGSKLFGGGGKSGQGQGEGDKKSVGKQKFAENAIKNTVRSAFSVESLDWKAGNVQDLKKGYGAALTAASDRASARYSAQWSAFHDQLSQLSDVDLETAHEAAQHAIGSSVEEIQETLIDRAVVGWTNFLAQMTHGKMKPWDLWETNGSKGAMATKDAVPPPSAPSHDPTGANVDPSALDKKVELGQGGHEKTESGILEIFVDGQGQLIEHLGMRLGDAGPEVRKRLAQMGRVGDLRVNKLIRVGNPQEQPLTVEAAILVTADGYIRDVKWPSNQYLHIEYDSPVGPGRIPEGFERMQEIREGHESSKAHRVRSKERANVTRIVELVQNLSMNALKP